MSVRIEPDPDPADETSHERESTSPSQPRIAKDDAFHILQNSRRRAVLRYITAHDDREQFVMRDLAEEVAAWEHDTTVAQLVSEERQRVYIALYQSHLPKLDEYGIIEYNQSRGIIERTPLTPVLEPYLDDGLHADADLTLDRNDDGAGDGDDRDRGMSLTTAVSTLFR